jgi:Zn-dependent peptidase ImmA (M78 family)
VFPPVVVESEPVPDALPGVPNGVIGGEVDFFVFETAPESLNEHVVHPAFLVTVCSKKILIQRPTDISQELLSDLEMKLETADLLSWLENKAESLSAYGDTGLWIEISPAILNEFGVEKYVYSKDTLGMASVILAEKGKHIIQHHRLGAIEDQRFWIAHELGHILWRNPNNPTERLSRYERTLNSDPTIEWLCNRFAAALLLPRSVLLRTITKFGMVVNGEIDYRKIGQIPKLAKALRVSEQLLARRIWQELGKFDIATFALKVNRDCNDEQDSWKVQWDVIPRYQVYRKRKLYGRKIPLEMVPKQLPYDGALDGRRVVMIKDLLSGRRGKILSRLRDEFPQIYGYAVRSSFDHDERFFIAVFVGGES